MILTTSLSAWDRRLLRLECRCIRLLCGRLRLLRSARQGELKDENEDERSSFHFSRSEVSPEVLASTRL